MSYGIRPEHDIWCGKGGCHGYNFKEKSVEVTPRKVYKKRNYEQRDHKIK